MRTQTTPQQDRGSLPSKEGAAAQPRAAKGTSKKTAPVGEMRAEGSKPESASARTQQPRQRKEEQAGRRPVRFCFRTDGAQNVAVAGSFNGWQPDTRLTERNGEWVGNIDLEPGTYEYRFVVDGQWLEDPSAASYATNPYGGRNSVITV